MNRGAAGASRASGWTTTPRYRVKSPAVKILYDLYHQQITEGRGGWL